MFPRRFPDFAFELSSHCLENRPVSRAGIHSTGDIFPKFSVATLGILCNLRCSKIRNNVGK